jgi:hypothetical protein
MRRLKQAAGKTARPTLQLPYNRGFLMKQRFFAALGAYAALAILAGFTLEGVLRYAVWILMAGLAVKTWIAHRAGW